MEPVIVQAFKCPRTNKTFVSKEKWDKHVAKLAEEDLKKELAKTKRADAVEALAEATSIEDAFDRMNAVIRKHLRLRGYSGRFVKLEIQIADGGLSFSNDRHSNDSYIEIRRFRLCTSEDHSGFGTSELRELFYGLIDTGGGGYSGRKWTAADGTYYEDAYVCEYSFRIYTKAIPKIMERANRLVDLHILKNDWEEEISRKADAAQEQADLSDPSSLDKLAHLSNEEEGYETIIAEFQGMLNAVRSQKREVIEARQKELVRIHNGIREKNPFGHAEELDGFYVDRQESMGKLYSILLTHKMPIK